MQVLPAEPVRATTVGAEACDDGAGEGAEGRRTSATTIAGTPTGRVASTAAAPACDDRALGVVVAVDPLAGEGGEEAAGLAPRGSR